MKFFFLILFVSCSSLNLKNIHVKAPEKKETVFNLKWIKNLDPYYKSGNLPIGTSSPYIFEDILYMGDLSGKMTAYDMKDGSIIWEVLDNGPIQSQVNKVEDTIFYGSKNGRLYARHYLTGKLKYSIDLASPIESQPSYYKGRLIVNLRNHSVIVLDASTGKIFWRYQRSIPYVTTLQRVSKPLPFQNEIILGFADGYIVSLSLDEGIVVWEQKLSTGVKFVDVDVKPLFFNNYIVAGSAAGPLRMLNPETGTIEKTIELYQSHTPLVSNGDMIVGSTSGIVYRIDKYGKIREQSKVSDFALSSIVTWKDGFIATLMGGEILYLNNEFKVQEKFLLGSDQSAIFGEAIVSSEKEIAVYSSRNRLYIFN